MTDLVQKLVGALEAARNQTRHPDYDWPICLTHEIDAAISEAKAGGWVAVPLQVLQDASEALGNFVSDYGWGDSDMQAMDNLDAYIATHKARTAPPARRGEG